MRRLAVREAQRHGAIRLGRPGRPVRKRCAACRPPQAYRQTRRGGLLSEGMFVGARLAVAPTGRHERARPDLRRRSVRRGVGAGPMRARRSGRRSSRPRRASRWPHAREAQRRAHPAPIPTPPLAPCARGAAGQVMGPPLEALAGPMRARRSVRSHNAVPTLARRGEDRKSTDCRCAAANLIPSTEPTCRRSFDPRASGCRPCTGRKAAGSSRWGRSCRRGEDRTAPPALRPPEGTRP